MKKLLIIAALFSAVLFSRPASAGLVFKYVDLVEVTGLVGYEHAVLLSGSLQLNANNPVKVDQVSMGGALGGIRAGIRFAPLSLGVLYQKTSDVFDLEKLQGYLGINAQYGRWLLLFDLRGGQATLTAAGHSASGFGGGLGLNLDFYIKQWVSVGLGLSGGGSYFDLGNDSKAGSYDVDGVFRLGLHL